ncbi:AMP-binding protein [Dactylosporangium sp. AC04546]|uniref:AMP-binding protein n=1 Tax=Dactylosporangium sp. AC04546 TaxID=2862460 RepID=UPI001EDFE943|nr:AMP-binding protein [Dactylosporangium sp. AC04546]WVK86935.1 AMP-binding protein [Dactylosporangium sp. AC04546]
MHIVDLSRLTDRVVGRVLSAQAEHAPDATWLMSDDRVVTFGEARQLVSRIAASLSGFGVGRGDVIAMHMDPSIELVLTGIGASELGAMFAPMSTDYHGEFLSRNIAASTARVLITDAHLAERYAEVDDMSQVQHLVVTGTTDLDALRRPGLTVHAWDELLSSEPIGLPSVAKYDDVLMMWWSSGTTGAPKGIMQTHAGLMRSAHYWIADRDIRDDEVWYSCLPMYLGGAYTTALWPSLVSGTAIGIDPRLSVSKFWDRVRHYQATQIFTLGAMHMFLMQADECPDDRDNPVRCAVPVPMPWSDVPRFKERFGIPDVQQAYGQSEVPCRIFAAPDDGTAWRANAIGRPVPWLEVRLVDDNDEDVPVGEVGEIVVRPKEPFMLFAGYFNAPDVTAQTWRNLWHHTGDLARCDEEGQYFFADRKKDYIRYKGRNISMVEVEAVVAKHPDVADVAAFGRQSAELESEAELALAVVPRAGVSLAPDDLACFINDNAPYYFVPRYIEIVSELPRNAQYKTDKVALRSRPLAPDVWDRDLVGFEVKR